MPEVFITLEEAAAFEGVVYDTMKKRVKRSPEKYKTKTEPRESGGKDKVMVSVASLSTKARKAYRAAQKVEGRDVIIEQRANTTPWYVDADLNYYIENNKKAFYEAVDLANQIHEFVNYDGSDRTAYAERYALGLGISAPTLYRYAQNVLEANAWALKLEKEDGQSRDYFRALSLCRKPKERATFPSLTDEQKAVIENIWFDPDFANNQGTIEMLYDYFKEEAVRRGWESYPSIKTAARYIKHIMERRGAESARYLAANGTREWKNKKQLKCKRDTSTLEVMEYVVADAHTFDLWVQYTAPNGKAKAIRPTVVAWEDMKSRCILGPVICEHSNAQVVKESVVKMVYSPIGGVPRHMHTDNGKDFTAEAITGQNRKERTMDKVMMDSETRGFILSIGVEKWTRSIPYQPWGKPIERAFRTFCMRHSKKYKSYVGTLTASKTEAKRKKDIDGMLKRGELLTIEEFYEMFQRYLDEDYHVREHRGLKDAGEEWTTPIEVFQNAPRYEKAAPPREYAAMLLMKAATALVTSQGINKFRTLYTDPGGNLCHYVDQKVGVKWDIDDVTKLYVFDKSGKKICEAVSAELMQYGDRVSQEALKELSHRKNRQLTETRDVWEDFTTPYEQRVAEGRAPGVVGKLDLMIKADHGPKVVSLPNDKEFRSEMAGRAAKKKRTAGDEFLDKKADAALSRLRARAINE